MYTVYILGIHRGNNRLVVIILLFPLGSSVLARTWCRLSSGTYVLTPAHRAGLASNSLHRFEAKKASLQADKSMVREEICAKNLEYKVVQNAEGKSWLMRGRKYISNTCKAASCPHQYTAQTNLDAWIPNKACTTRYVHVAKDLSESGSAFSSFFWGLR